MILASLSLRTIDIWLPVVLAFLTALVLILVVERRAPGVLRGLVALTALILVGLWAGAYWLIRPLGLNELFSALWYGIGAVGLGVLAALATPRVPGSHRHPQPSAREVAMTVGYFFWLLMLGLLGLWVAGMLLT